MPNTNNESIISTTLPIIIDGNGNEHFVKNPHYESGSEYLKKQTKIIGENCYLRENYVNILGKYGFRDQNGKKLEDYNKFVKIVENEENFTDEHGHPLKNSIEYKQICKVYFNAASVSTDPIHNFFGLSYSSYLVLRRSVMQSAPLEWQQRFCALMEDLEEMFDGEYLDGKFTVQMRDEKGRFIADDYADYERGRRVIPMKGENK